MILNKSVDNRDGAASCFFDQFHRSEQRRRIGKGNDIGEESAKFDFRVDTRLKPAKHLDHIIRADKHCRVRLLGIDRSNIFDCAADVRERTAGSEFQASPFLRTDGFALLRFFENE